MFISRVASLLQRPSMVQSSTLLRTSTPAMSTFSTKTKKNGVYLWSKMPRLGPKGGAVSSNLQMPKGMP